MTDLDGGSTMAQILITVTAVNDPPELSGIGNQSIEEDTPSLPLTLNISDLETDATELRLSATQESQVFHIVQESLANIAKHASARHAWLSIRQVLGRVDVVVEDDGTGPTGDAVVATSNHFGVDIMRERAARVGGRIDIGPREGGGMRVHLSFPLAINPATGT